MFSASGPNTTTTRPTTRPPATNRRRNDRDAERKRGKRREQKLVVIPKCADPERRARLEADDEAWLLWYFAPEACPRNPFSYAFVDQQKEIIATVGESIRTGRDAALAASRGEGKTTICERLTMKYILTGKTPASAIAVFFAVLFAATGASAEASLEEIKDTIEHNDRLAADYPEVCFPVRALEGAPQRAHSQIASGFRHDNGEPFEAAATRFKWCGQEIILPDIPGSPSALSIIATRGLDSAVRGLKRKGRRPDLILIDDPDTQESAESEQLALKLEKTIERAIGGLGGQQRRAARVIITTLPSRKSVSYRYTDRKQKPFFRGRRFRFLIAPPVRSDLWDDYVLMRKQDELDDTTKAHDYYLKNRKSMDEGAVVANPNRKTSTEASALEFYFVEIARIGPEAVATEYDNDPPEESGPIESGITAARIQKQISGYARKVIPPGCTVLTQGIDVRKIALHWTVRAWKPDGSGYTIDYGVHELHGTTRGSDEGIETAVYNAIGARMTEFRESGYVFPDNKPMPAAGVLSLVDAGWQTQTVYRACRDNVGLVPIMGFGKSAGCVRTNFRELTKSTDQVKPGDGYRLVKRGRLWLVEADADRWKSFEHARWMTGPGRPGRLEMYGEIDPVAERLGRMSDDQKRHFSYAQHLTNEIEIEEPHKGTLRRRWKSIRDNNHWLDASYYSCVGARIRGITVSITAPAADKPTTPKPKKAPKKKVHYDS